MPELPEVESLRRSLSRTLIGRTIAAADLRLPKLLVAPPGRGPESLVGKTVLDLRRRAKFLIVDLSGDDALVLHLRLAGQIVHRDRQDHTLAEGGHPVPAWGAPLPHKSTHLILSLDDGSTLYVTDIRQFGRVWLLSGAGVEPLLAKARLGPEPLAEEFTVDVLRARLARRPRAQLKPLLLDQSFVGGVGNIYADEIIYASSLRPDTVVGQIDDERVAGLHDAIKSVLHFAVADGVAQILNGKTLPGRDFPRVHGRAGQPCPRCGTTIAKTRFAGRGTYTCPRCQGPGVGGQGPGNDPPLPVAPGPRPLAPRRA